MTHSNPHAAVSNGDPPRVLTVGHCQFDHTQLVAILKRHFDVEIDSAADIPAALHALCERPYRLVLINRILDATAQEGIDLLARIKTSPYLREVPVMIVSNFATAQQEAVQAGAVPGFGKTQLDNPRTIEQLTPYLTK